LYIWGQFTMKWIPELYERAAIRGHAIPFLSQVGTKAHGKWTFEWRKEKVTESAELC